MGMRVLRGVRDRYVELELRVLILYLVAAATG